MKDPLSITIGETFTMLKVGEASKPWAQSCEDVNPCCSFFGAHKQQALKRFKTFVSTGDCNSN